MKIENSKKSILFSELKSGDCFSHSGNPYIKLEASNAEKITASGPAKVNAVRLYDGWLGFFNDQTPITLNADAKVVVQ